MWPSGCGANGGGLASLRTQRECGPYNTQAQTRLRQIVLKIARERSSAATTSNRSERMSTMSAASIATEVPDDNAMPTVAAATACRRRGVINPITHLRDLF